MVSLDIKYNTPIEVTEANEETKEAFKIFGKAITATTTKNKHTYPAEELEKSAKTLIGRPLLKDHKAEVDSVIGKVTNSYYKDNAVHFEADMLEGHSKELVKQNIIKSVSIGAMAEATPQENSDNVTISNIRFQELSLIPVAGDDNATIDFAIGESYNSEVKKMIKTNQKFVEENLFNKKLNEFKLELESKMRDIATATINEINEAAKNKLAEETKLAEEAAKVKEAEEAEAAKKVEAEKAEADKKAEDAETDEDSSADLIIERSRSGVSFWRE